MASRQSVCDVLSQFTSEDPEVIMASQSFNKCVFERMNLVLYGIAKDVGEHVVHYFDSMFDRKFYYSYINKYPSPDTPLFTEYLATIIGLLQDDGAKLMECQTKFLL
jgi:hypothetical protein